MGNEGRGQSARLNKVTRDWTGKATRVSGDLHVGRNGRGYGSALIMETEETHLGGLFSLVLPLPSSLG